MRTPLTIAIITATLLSGCAGINETNRRFADVDARIKALEAKSDSADQALDAKVAGLSSQHGNDVAAINARLDKHDADISKLAQNVQEALDRAKSAHQLAEGKFVYNKVLNGDAVNFSSGKANLPEATQEALKAFAQKLIADNQNVYLEIQGHTDGTGPEAINVSLGLRRAEAVRQFLNQQGIALNRMSTISYGKVVPVESNKTAKGRAANRRVEIIVLK